VSIFAYCYLEYYGPRRLELADFLSVSEFSALHGKDPGNVRRLIQQGRLPAQRIGNQWAIPADTHPPADKRVKSGQYKGWRKKGNPESEV